jgi:two-component system, response regulator
MVDLNAVEILIVEDNPRDAELTLRALKKNNLANNILVASDGAEALDFFFCRGKYEMRSISHPPKVVLLDLKLPKIGGLEVLKAVKSDKRTSHIPIVVVTSSRQEPDMIEAYALGVNSYVVKPVDFSQFISAMSSLGLYWLLVNEPLKS